MKIGFRRFGTLLLALAGVLCFAGLLAAQTNVGSGSIQGTVTDSTGAVVPGAKVTITNTGTKQTINQTTNSRGVYDSGSLTPGTYTVEVAGSGFKTHRSTLTVQVGVTTNGNAQLGVGESSQIVEVTGTEVAQVDTTQATVQGVLTPEQIETLPVDGRNFLNLAQLEPGVQLQDGQNFDPTKAGYSSVSFNGVNGRTARIELDGVDVSDETVGTTTLNISSGSIQEFQISRSTLDLSTELTSSGSINVETKSGTNSYHGEGFGLFRDRRVGFANSPGDVSTPFQRNQFGGSFGGAIIKDKLFFFANAERIKQDQLQPQSFSTELGNLFNGGFTSPFRDTYTVGRLDYQAPKGVHMFYRFAYEENKSEANFGFGYAVYANRDNTPAQAAGVDFNTGSFTHSIRWGYEKFHNLIGDGTGGLPAALNPFPEINVNVINAGLETGPNLLAPQQTYQSDHQVKYDGSKVWGNHILRFGTSFNRINGGGFASFFGLAPQVVVSTPCTGNSPGCDTNIADYTPLVAVVGNGQGFFTEKPAFGAPAGGQQDDRFSIYAGDTWKIRPNLTLTYGLRWLRDTGRSDSDLAPIPCSAVAPSVVAAGAAPCTGSSPLLDSLVPGLGNSVNQPNANFGPQVGIAWDPTGKGKTVIRAGAGIYYENSIFNNTLFDRPPKLAQGLFFANTTICGSSTSIQFPNANGSSTKVTTFNGQSISAICSEPLSQSAAPLAGIQKAYQAAVAAAGPAANPNFIGNDLAVPAAAGLALYAPDYKPTRSYQMNLGVQHQLWQGAVITADYIRNVGLDFPLTIDVNHVGDARYLNKAAATAAIAATTAGFGCAGGATAAAINCAIGAGATINDFAGNGLDSGLAFDGSEPYTIANTAQAAFGGINPLWGQTLVEYPIGHSTYNGLQLNFRQQSANPFPFFKAANFEASYTLSRFVSDGGNDQNFSATAFDFADPGRFSGPTALDRTHQLSFGGTFDSKWGPRISLISHFYSAPPSNIVVGDAGFSQTDAAEIFRTDFTGDGTVEDPLPGTNLGAFGRSVSASQIAQVVTNYNSSQAGTLTPAGQALVGAGLFTAAQLNSLGAVKPALNVPSANAAPNGILRTFDFKLSYPIKLSKLREGVEIEPSVAFFNLFNFVNYGSYTGTAQDLIPVVDPTGAPQSATAGTIGGTVTSADRLGLRSGNGSGTFAQGSPRETEFGLTIRF